MSKAAVIGLGTMGPGIAATLARAGYTVSTFDADPGQRAKAQAGFDIATTVLGSLGVPEQPHAAITVAETLSDCVAGAELAIENVSEKLDVKIAVFREIEAAVSKTC